MPTLGRRILDAAVEVAPYVVLGAVDVAVICDIIGTNNTSSSETSSVRIMVTQSTIAEAPTDPNFISGPSGYGTPGFVPDGGAFPYTINFENKPSAPAPAQVVEVTQQLDSDLDWSTFQLGDFGFGGQLYAVPAGLKSYQTRIDARSTTGVYVDVDAAFDEQTGVVTWTFTSIDPTTLDVPAGNPEEGFLPPDNTSDAGVGFVTYIVAPKSTDTTATLIDAKATVTFQAGLPDQSSLDTAPISNTIDAGAPTSSVAALPASSPSMFTVLWAGQDDAGGSGIASFDIYVSDNGGPFTAWLTGTQMTSATYTGQNGHTYAFYSVATDNVGHVQVTPATAQTTTTVHVAQPTTLAAVSGAGTYGGTATLTATLTAGGVPLAGQVVTFTLTAGGITTSVGTATTGSNGVATLRLVSLAGLPAGTAAGAVGASFAGDSSYAGSKATGSLVVASAASPLRIVGERSLFLRKLNKKGKPTGKAVLSGFEFDFSGPLDSASATTPGNFQVDTLTTKRVKKLTKRVLHPITRFSTTYNSSNNSIALKLVPSQTFKTGGQITVLGGASRGVTGASGASLTSNQVFTISAGGKTIHLD